LRETILLDDEKLAEELLRMTDSYVDELFSPVVDAGGVASVFELSRLIVDPERFEEDEREVMSSRGMGVIYTKTSNGTKLREPPEEGERIELLSQYYRPYHSALEYEVQNLLDIFNRCLILDCHSFSSRPLPCELDQNPDRPDICLGTDPYHTPEALMESVEVFFYERGLKTAVNKPFVGTYVPMKFYQADNRVSSVMIEVNRGLYMEEETGEKSASFNSVRETISDLINRMPEE
jgi:N-formylglutamate amidohydrolase